MRLVTLVLLSVSLLCAFQHIRTYNILGICPTPSYSHVQTFQALMKALAARGHKVTFISPIPLKNPPPNFVNVDISFIYQQKNVRKLSTYFGVYESIIRIVQEANNLCEKQLLSPAIKDLLESNKTFHAIIIEHLWYQCYYALVKHYNFPVLMGLLSVGDLPFVMDSVGNPDDPNLNPNMMLSFTDRMTLSERIQNILLTTWIRLTHQYYHLPQAQYIANKLSPNISVHDIERNMSLIILSNNHVFGYSKPLLPHVVSVHSLQIQEKPDPLPEEIQEFLDNAQDGAIYFSLGTNVHTHHLSAGSLTVLCSALSSLKQRILWKHGGYMAIQPTNIKFVKWVPQQAVLAHPRIVAYVMQGGLQSLQEAVHYSVPLVAIPVYGDQFFNAHKILDAGIGLTLNIDTMTENSIIQTIVEVIENKTYLENVERMSAIVRDELIKPMNKAVWNVEHVLKFPNSRHLQYHGRDMSWIDHYATFLCLSIPFIILIYISYRITFACMKCIWIHCINMLIPAPILLRFRFNPQRASGMADELIHQSDEEIPMLIEKRKVHQLQKEKNAYKIRKYCSECYKNNSKYGRKIAKNMTKRVATFCNMCENKPYLCLDCFNKFH